MHDDGLFDADFAGRLERLAWVLRKKIASGGEGGRTGSRKGGLIEFAEHRDYAPGDDLRYVDWNAYARLDLLAVKEYSRDEEVPFHVILDCSASMAADGGAKMRTAAQASAALAFVGLTAGNPVSFRCARSGAGRALNCLRGKGSLGRITELISSETPSGPTALHEAVRASASAGRNIGLLVLVSDLMDNGPWRMALSAASQAGCEVCVLQVLSRLEAAPEVEGPLTLVDSETGMTIDIDVGEIELDAFRSARESGDESLARFASARGMRVVTALAGTPLEDLVLDTLRNANWLRFG